MNIVLIKYILRAAVRDKLLLSVFIMMIVMAALSTILGSSSIIEKIDFASVYIAGSLRIIAVFGLALFIAFYIRRLFDSKEIEFILSKPISRVSFIISHSIAFSILSLVFSLFVGIIIFGFQYESFNENHLIWIISLFVELVIISNAALFFSMVLSSASSTVMSVLGFYVLSRMIGQLLSIIYSSGNSIVAEYLGFIMQTISMVIPRLDLMSQTTWLIYGIPNDISVTFILVHGALFSGLLVSAALVDLIRRKF